MAKAEIGPDGTKIVVRTDYREKELVKSVPGSRWSTRNGYWTLPLSWGSCVTLRGVFGDGLHVDDSLNTWAWNERTTRIDPSVMLRTAVEGVGGDPRLYDFQRAGVAWLRTAQSGLLTDEMGTGKGVQLPAALAELYRSGADVLPAVVICPNSTKHNWRKELLAWFPESVPYLLEGTSAKRRKTIAAGSGDPAAVFIVNIEGVRQFTRLAPYGGVALRRCRDCDPISGQEAVTPARCEAHPREFNELPLRSVVFDEAHRAKTPESKQTRAWWALAHQDGVVLNWAATGTPVADNPADVWSLAHGVRKDDFPTRSKFIDRYALRSYNPFGGMTITGLNPDTRDEFFMILDPILRRTPKALVLKQLPPKVRTQRYVQMSAKQAKAYHELAGMLLTRLDDGTLMVSKGDLANVTRLMQLSSSYVRIEKHGSDDPKVWDVVLQAPSPKIDELLAILEDMDPARQVAACAASRQLIELAAERLDKEKISYSLITGKVSTAERDHQLRQFQEGKARVMLFTIAAGGTGLTMTAADTIVFMQRSWSMIENCQAEDRVHRIGSEVHASVNIIDIITEGTVEETHQIPALLEKLERLEEIVRDRARLQAAGLPTADLDNEEARLMHDTV